MNRMVAMLFQHCNAVLRLKSSLRIVANRLAQHHLKGESLRIDVFREIRNFSNSGNSVGNVHVLSQYIRTVGSKGQLWPASSQKAYGNLACVAGVGNMSKTFLVNWVSMNNYSINTIGNYPLHKSLIVARQKTREHKIARQDRRKIVRFVRYLKNFSLLRGQEVKINYTINVKMNFSLFTLSYWWSS